MDIDIIKGLIKNKSPKAKLVAKKSVADVMPKKGNELQSNAATPNRINTFAETMTQLKVSQEIKIPRAPSEPILRMPQIQPLYKTLGEKMNICPYELRDILTHDYTEENEIALSLLKKFVVAVKLSGTVDFSNSRENIRLSEERFKNETEWQKQEVEKINNLAAEKEQKIKTGSAELRKIWHDILIDLVTKLQRNQNINDLGTLDYWLVKALKAKSSKYVKVDRQHQVTIDYQKCKSITSDGVQQLFKDMSTMRESHAAHTLRSELHRASDDKLEMLARMYQDEKDPRLAFVLEEIDDRDDRTRRINWNDPYSEWREQSRYDKYAKLVNMLRDLGE